MKDYSNVKFVKPSVDGLIAFRKGKAYALIDSIDDSLLATVQNDFERKTFILIDGCAHLDGGHWIPCDENGKAIRLKNLK